MRRAIAVVLAVAVATAVLAGGRQRTAAADEPEPVVYQPPVDAPVVDGFRPPASTYGAGNRGVDYATGPGTPVGAAAGGRVVFAGRVGGGLHVVVLHGDGLRTSYSFLASVVVRRGARVAAGDPVGTAGSALHFGARAGEAYLDPLVLLGGGGRAVVHLVPEDGGTPGTEGQERRGLGRYLAAAGRLAGAVGSVAGTAVAWAAGAPGRVVGAVPTPADVAVWLAAVRAVVGPPWEHLVRAGLDWWASRGACTPASTPPPPLPGRRRLVLVAGLGSTSASAAVDDLDTAALGYGRTDVLRFSYRGGTTAEHAYGGADTTVDIAESGRRLRELLERLHAADPGVPIDVVAHSQGGLVARVALGSRAPPAVATLVTLGTPHHGADLATGLRLARLAPPLRLALAAAATLVPPALHPEATSVAQMAETSAFLRTLNAGGLPEGVRITSVAARTDPVVASPRTRLAGAHNVVVSVGVLDAHDRLPGSAAATREVALAIAGLAPTCQGFWDAAVDALAGQAIATGEDLAAVGLTAGALAGPP